MKKILLLLILACNLQAADTVSSDGAKSAKVVKAGAGALVSLTGYNSKASAQFVQIHNAAAIPANGAVPLVVFTVPATSNFSLTFPTGLKCNVGIVVCNSSTAGTKTLGSADIIFAAQIE